MRRVVKLIAIAIGASCTALIAVFAAVAVIDAATTKDGRKQW